MAHLPFLIVYGAWVWKVALVVPVALCFGGIGWARRWIAENDAAEAGKLAPGPICLVGTLRGGTITRVTQRRRWAGRRDADLWLEHGAERIQIAGAVQLEAGATARASWFARNVPVPTMQARLRPTLVQTVADGDEIVVSAVIERVAADASYREAPVRWRLVAPSGAAMRAWSTSPRVRPLPLGPWRSAAIALAAATVGCMMMARLGQYFVPDEGGPHLGTTSSIELAAALPGWRGDALDALEATLANRNQLDELLALYAFEGKCPDEVLANAGRFDEAIASALRCDNPKRAGELSAVRALKAAEAARIDEALTAATAAHEAHLTADLLAWAGRIDDAIAAAKGGGDAALAVSLLVQTGRFDDASPLLDAGSGSLLGATVAIARGEWRRAASEVALLPDVKRDAIHGDCLVPLFVSWSGDAHAFDGFSGCTAYVSLAAELASGGVAAIVPGTYTGEPTLVTGSLAAAGDASHPMFTTPRFWLGRFVLSADASAQQAWIDLVRGDFAAAHQALASGSSEITPYVAARLALHEGSAMPVPVVLENQAPWWQLRANETVPSPRLCIDEPVGCPFGAALEAAEHGDGGALADTARAYGHDWTSVADDVLALAPRITAHRAELAAALHTVSAEAPGSIFTFAENAAARRDIAHLLGDEAAAATWQAAVTRFDAVLADRQKATALVLLEPP